MDSKDALEPSIQMGRAERLGNLFFRYRSWMPFVLAILLPAAIVHFHYPLGDPKLDLPWELICLTVSLMGFGIRVMTAGFAPKGTSGRNTSGQKAQGLNTTGMYSLVRNPLYLGNSLVWLGVVMFPRVWWVLAVVMAMFAFFHIFIIHAESQFLRRKFGREYADWAGKTPVFIPRLRGWKQPELPFCFRTVCRREHASFFALIVSFVVIEILGDIVIQRRPEFDLFWAITFSISLVIYVLLRTLKKSTTHLKVSGR